MAPQLMTILDIKHYNQDGEVIWEQFDIPNTFHQLGETYLLSLAFDTDAGYEAPNNYYIGLDARGTLTYADTIGIITNEPTTNGYTRQSISSVNGFTVSLVGSRMKATSAVMSFSATGGSWGPVSNAFLATTSDGSGVLIASSALASARTLNAGEYITLRFGLSFRTC